MKNIWKIFTGDLKKLRNNTIAWIVIMGLTIVPSLYAWFNIAASWDPYSNTGNLRVAVASLDEGYEGTLFPIKLNLGEKVISALRGNTQLDWVFTDDEGAVHGVKAGDYYAAIILPETFSRDLMSMFTDDIRRADIKYYLNEKVNAIAPKVTDKGAGAVQKQIDEIFAGTIAEIGLAVTEGIAGLTEDGDGRRGIAALSANLRQEGADFRNTAKTVRAFSVIADALQQIGQTSGELLKSGEKTMKSGQVLLRESSQNMSDLTGSVVGTADAVGQVLLQWNETCSQLEAEVDQAFDLLGTDMDSGRNALVALQGQVEQRKKNMAQFQSSLVKLEQSLPEDEQLLRERIHRMSDQVGEIVASQQKMEDTLQESIHQTDRTREEINRKRDGLKKQIHAASDAVAAMEKDYEENVEVQLLELTDSMQMTIKSMSRLMTQLDKVSNQIEILSKEVDGDLTSMKTVLDDSADLLEQAAGKLEAAADSLADAASSEKLDTIGSLLKSDPQLISSFLAAPVSLDTTRIYPVENYGSAMAPFYSVLSIWVGGTILVAMMKVSVSRKRQEELENVKDYQLYLGRWILFLIIGLLQSGLICLGDLFFLEIQCVHPMYFLFAGWFASIVFVNLIYTLTVSFGDTGKAICVVLMVIQVAGSGGTFPIEMTPEFFQRVYLLMPFSHAMTAMREAIAGIYGNTYWIELGYLSLFMAASLLLGLVLRRPVIRMNEAFAEKLEDTRLM